LELFHVKCSGLYTDRKVVGKRGWLKDRIALADVVDVTESVGVNPPSITIHLAKPCKLGRRVGFVPIASSRFNPLASHTLVEELRERAQRARAKRSVEDGSASASAPPPVSQPKPPTRS
jgi:hypothetical protein